MKPFELNWSAATPLSAMPDDVKSPDGRASVSGRSSPAARASMKDRGSGVSVKEDEDDEEMLRGRLDSSPKLSQGRMSMLSTTGMDDDVQYTEETDNNTALRQGSGNFDFSMLFPPRR